MIEILTSGEMGEADRRAIAAGIDSFALMQAAGRAVAAAAARLCPGGPVVVVAGPGNNGGDGYVAAKVLAGQGRQVIVLSAGDRSRMKGDAARAAAEWTGTTGTFAPDALAHAALIVDALFGAGLDRPVEGEAAAIIAAINASAAKVLAVDLPSGVSGTSGDVMGVAVRADATVTFFRRKVGHLLLPGRVLCGEIVVADIGIPDSVLAGMGTTAFANEPALWRSDFPVPRIDGHKYARGHACVVSGGLSSTGAARLAARGALRAGAGLVTILSPADALAVHAATNLAVMVREANGPADLAAWFADSRHNACVIGPGLGVGARARDLVLTALASEAALVLDADALTSFEETPDLLSQAIKKRLQGITILTPHDGEFRRLFNKLIPFSNNLPKLEKAKLAAKETGAVVLLKGPDSVVAAPDGRASIAANAPPWLATAGSGDVLAGFIVALLAQGMEPFAATSAAVWLHGEAANAFGPGLISEDLPETLPQVLRVLLARDGADGSA